MSNKIPSIPTVPYVRERAGGLLSQTKYDSILWAGVFGSVSREKSRPDSDIDIILVFKDVPPSKNDLYVAYLDEDLRDVLGRKVDLVWLEKRQIWGYITLEALLSARTIHGSLSDIQDLVAEAERILYDGIETAQTVPKLCSQVRERLVPARSDVEVFLQNPVMKRDCLRLLRAIASLLDFEPRGHPLETAFAVFGGDVARKSLIPHVLGADLTDDKYWRNLWHIVHEVIPQIQRGIGKWGLIKVRATEALMRVVRALDAGELPDPALVEFLET
ncbi:uncharacterized protein LAESUDRAFT_726280 [Laetiporus sulphureus 93-53]|uniref:Polymerase beta nucleotidyltransferase domain-containing protein n=1 Tax=Laetiporus sulphureus 93-53 TaxID=1314785 RepID=A0A165E1M2_9APHY|nr:uncharacterized protein LAESUDRAFT_726280 [Laetiporus sulphureus 93-53]KZT06073.1 hypothetical protein LAESUDRAFT_726280 [Laetiporus sulphureus 93-53]